MYASPASKLHWSRIDVAVDMHMQGWWHIMLSIACYQHALFGTFSLRFSSISSQPSAQATFLPPPHPTSSRYRKTPKFSRHLGESRRIEVDCSTATYYWMDPATACLFLQILASWPLDFLAMIQIKIHLARISRSHIAHLSTFPISSDVPWCLVFFLLFNDRVISSNSICSARLPSLEKLWG